MILSLGDYQPQYESKGWCVIHFILGGARSGKSSLAEKLAVAVYEKKNTACSLSYLATSTAFTPADIGDENSAQYENMEARIQHHKQSRDKRFTTIEEPVNISSIIQGLTGEHVLLLDCLTLWLSNCLMQGYNMQADTLDLSEWENQKRLFLAALQATQAHIFLVSNEVGHGIVPMGMISRAFVDEAGWLHQEIAKIADQVSFVTAGIEQRLK